MATHTLAPPAITQHEIDIFFEAYAARFNDSLSGKPVDVNGTVSAFADCFVEAGPAGIQCGKNDQWFRDALSKGQEFYKQTGMKAMVIEAKDLTILDELHALVRVHWRSDHEKREGTRVSIPFEVIYLLQSQEKGLKIFAYITGDEQKVMKEKGVLPDQTNRES